MRKDRQHNGQKEERVKWKKNKQLHSELNIQQLEQHKKQRVNTGAPEGIVPFSLVASVMLILFQTPCMIGSRSCR